jgi:glycosyltransferase involved in cell wall biosynthesis
MLVLAYHFPPVGGAGVQRSVKFVRYLPEHDFEPVVVTGPVGSVGDAHLVDATLGKELPPGLEVHRVDGPEPRLRAGWPARAERVLRLRAPWARWWGDRVTAAGRTVEDVDLVFASMSPFESCAPAAQLASLHGVPWVADLRDPWALDEMRVYPSRLHRRLETRHMRSSLASAAAVIMNTLEAEKALVAAFPELADRAFTITNGFDASDFSDVPPPFEDRRFRIVHTGTLHTAFGLRQRSAGLLRRALGGAIDDVDVLARSHVFLLEAVSRLFGQRPELRGHVEVHLAGDMDTADSAAVDANTVVQHGYLTHDAAVRLMQSADLLFLPMHGLPEGHRARIVPGKTYEYLASRRPILAAVPEGDARDLLLRAGSAFVCGPSDVDGMAGVIGAQVDRWRRGEAAPAPDEQVLAGYERRALTARLAEVLDGVVSGTARARTRQGATTSTRPTRAPP